MRVLAVRLRAGKEVWTEGRRGVATFLKRTQQFKHETHSLGSATANKGTEQSERDDPAVQLSSSPRSPTLRYFVSWWRVGRAQTPTLSWK
jgi:hypothetical protein